MAMSEQTRTKLKILFRTVHAIGKKAIPLSDFEWMCNLDEKKGIAVYRNEKQAKEFMHHIAKVERNNIRESEKHQICLHIRWLHRQFCERGVSLSDSVTRARSSRRLLASSRWRRQTWHT